MRTWLRSHLPYVLADRIPKGRDCGDHQWYRRDDDYEDCYHCVAGVRQSPAEPGPPRHERGPRPGEPIAF